MDPGWLGLMPCRKFDSHIAENRMVRRIQLFGGSIQHRLVLLGRNALETV